MNGNELIFCVFMNFALILVGSAFWGKLRHLIGMSFGGLDNKTDNHFELNGKVIKIFDRKIELSVVLFFVHLLGSG